MQEPTEVHPLNPVDCSKELSKTEAYPLICLIAQKPIWQLIKSFLGVDSGDDEKRNLGYTQDDLLMRLGAISHIYNRINAGIVNFSKNPNWFKTELQLSPIQQELAGQYIRFDELFDRKEDNKVRDAILAKKWIYGPNPLIVCAVAMGRISFVNWAHNNQQSNYPKVRIVYN